MTDLRGKVNVFIDDDGILRVKGRPENSSLPYSCKYPILLNRDSYLTQLFILKCHLFCILVSKILWMSYDVIIGSLVDAKPLNP